MWIPETEGEILAAVEAGDLTETASFDAKAALPTRGRSKDLAADVAAMANDGGVLLYGLGEDEHGRPVVPKPFELAGAAERVDQIVRTSISEPPAIEVRPVSSEADAGLGYLVVVVPPSPRAPHMVIVGGDHRFYGRSATGNVRLTEGEVARLYERRRRWEVDREALLGDAIGRAPIEGQVGFGYLHLVARPVVPDEDLLDRAIGGQHVAQFLNGLFSAALSPEVYTAKRMSELYPDLSATSIFVPSPNGWTTSRGLDQETLEYAGPRLSLVFEMGLGGGGYMFSGSAAEEHGGRLLLYEDQVAGLTVRFLFVLGSLYQAGRYTGPVDVGLAVTGLRGSVSAVLQDHRIHRHSLLPYENARYFRTGRLAAPELRDDPKVAARKLVLPLTRVITQERYDPLQA